jgi:hypothetical protein
MAPASGLAQDLEQEASGDRRDERHDRRFEQRNPFCCMYSTITVERRDRV